MCQNPHILPDGSAVACRSCWQCRENYINDWVGRCIAESKTASDTHSVTLTYGRDENGSEDHLRAALLTYSDVQMYLKLLRRHGYPCRYFAVGEYGSTKGRAHWHLILFWRGRVPNHQINRRFVDAKHWRHGFQHWEPVSAASIRYVCKYLQKDMGEEERQGHFSMSKQPPLGAFYFRSLAAEYVKQGIAPQDLFYWFPEVMDNRTGKPRQFMLAEGSASADLFCHEFLTAWAIHRGGHAPASELLDRYQDRRASSSAYRDNPPSNRAELWHRLDGMRFALAPLKGRVPVPKKPPPGGTDPKFSERHNCFYSETEWGRLWYSYNSEGDEVWHEKIGPSVTTETAVNPLVEYQKASRGH